MRDDLTVLLDRPRLAEPLDDLLRGDREPSAVLVSAPPGFGKTTLARAWSRAAEEQGWGVACLALGPADAHPKIFWRSVLRVLSATSGPVAAALVGLDTPDRAGDPTFLVELLDRLADRRVLLVLDDVHHLRDADVLADLDQFVRRLPPAARIALLGRTLPPLGLALDLGVSGRLLHLRAPDLAFTREESDLVCAALPAADRRAVWEATEGWPALTRLTGSAIRDGSSLPDLARGGSPLVDAVFVETLRRLSAPARHVLLAAATSEEMPLALLGHLSGRSDAGALLEDAAADVGLIERVHGPDGAWGYRLHGSLRAYLWAEQLRLDQPAAARQQARAARWFLERDERLPAVAHAVESGDTGLLDEVLSVVGLALVHDGDAERLLTTLPSRVRQSHGAWTRLVWVAALLDTGRIAQAAAALTEISYDDDPDAPTLAALSGALLAALRRIEGWPTEIPTGVVPEGLPADVELTVRLAHGRALGRLGRLDDAEAVLVPAALLAEGHGRPAALLEAHTLLGQVSSARSDFHTLGVRVGEAMAVADRHGWRDSERAAHAHLLAAWCARASLDDAVSHHHAMRAAALMGPRDDLTVRICVEAIAAVTRVEDQTGSRDDADRLHRLWRQVEGRQVGPDAVAYLARSRTRSCCTGSTDPTDCTTWRRGCGPRWGTPARRS